MRKYEDGEYKDMTAEEVSALQQEALPPSIEERLLQLEALLSKKEAE